MPQVSHDRTAPKRRSFKHEQLRLREKALVEAAAHLFARKGYDRTSIDDVVNAVGISKPTFYSHFASKEALAVNVIVSGLEVALSRTEEFAATLSPGEAARAMIDWAIDNQAMPNGHASFPGAIAFFDHEDVRAAENRLTRMLADLINRAQQEGTVGKIVHPIILSQTFRSIMKDNSLIDVLKNEKYDTGAIKESVKRLLFG